MQCGIIATQGTRMASIPTIRHHRLSDTFSERAAVESFNRHLRVECLNTDWFLSVDNARHNRTWRTPYNESLPHTALGFVLSSEYAQPVARNGGPLPHQFEGAGSRILDFDIFKKGSSRMNAHHDYGTPLWSCLANRATACDRCDHIRRRLRAGRVDLAGRPPNADTIRANRSDS
jgi:hypothetical protein